MGDAEQNEVQKMHSEAARLWPNAEKVHYHFGRFQDNVLTRQITNAKRKEVMKFGPAGARSGLIKQVVKTSERQQKQLSIADVQTRRLFVADDYRRCGG